MIDIIYPHENNNNIPEVFSPFEVTSDMEHIHTTLYTPKATTKTNSVQKDKLKHTFNISDIHTLRKTPKFSSHPLTSVVRIKTLRPQVSFPKLGLLNFREESLYTYRVLFGHLVNVPKTAGSQVQTIQLYSKSTEYPSRTPN